MTSSAAGALSGLLAQGGPKSSAPRPEGSASDASTAAPKRSPDDRKSALAASTVMTSSAAATLGALAAPKAKPKDPAPAPATQVSMKWRSPGSDELSAHASFASGAAGFVRNHGRKCIFLVLFALSFIVAAGPSLGNLRQSFSEERVASINAQLVDLTPQEILRWAHRALPGRVVAGAI
eukprot:s1507_g1.t1